jgi:hypothetical protein
MIYTTQDMVEFDTQINEIFDKKFIKETSRLHCSTTFMVTNHSKVKRGKSSVVINYKRLNE